MIMTHELQPNFSEFREPLLKMQVTKFRLKVVFLLVQNH